MGRFVRFGLMGCGGLVILVVLVSVLGALLGGGGGDTATETPDSAEKEPAAEQPAPEEQRPTAQMGETVTVGDVAWQVTNARQATELSSDLGTSKQGNFVIVDFNFTNNANEPVTLSSESLALFDGEERKFQTDTDAFEYIDPAKNIFVEQVNPGVARQEEAIFTVAPDASNFEIELGDAALFSDEAARVPLGF